LEKSFISYLNEKEHELLIQIIITCTTNIIDILSKHPNPKEYAKFMEKVIDNKTYIVGMKLFTELPNIHPEKLYTHEAIKKLISVDNISDSTFSKVYGEFVKRKLLKNHNNKNTLKDFRTHEFLTKRKKSNYKTAGRISFYQKESIVDEARELLSKPGAMEYIIDKLNDYDNTLINRFLELIFAAFLYFLPNHENRMEILIKSMHNYDKNKQIDLNTFEKSKNFCLPLTEQEIERIVKNSVQAIKKDPFFAIIIFILLAL
jgi:hypothetical protein